MSLPAATVTATANPWLRILGALEKKITRHSYDTWLKPTRFSHINGNIIFVRVPNAEFRQLGEKFGDLIQEAMDTLAPEYQDVKFITAEEDPTVPPVRADGGFAPVSVGGISQSIRIEVGGDLHEFGQLGKLVSAKEAEIII